MAIAMNRTPTPCEIGPTRTTPPPCIDVLTVLPELANQAKTTIRLHPRPLTAGESLPREASKLGGDLLWPASEPWPFCDEHQLPWVGVLQLRKNDFPELEFKPGTNVLQVLWCPQRGHDQYGSTPEPVVVWRDSAQITSVLDDIPAPHLPTPSEREDGWHQSNLQHDLHWLSLYKTNVDYMRRLTKHDPRVPVPSSDTWLPG